MGTRKHQLSRQCPEQGQLTDSVQRWRQQHAFPSRAGTGTATACLKARGETEHSSDKTLPSHSSSSLTFWSCVTGKFPCFSTSFSTPLLPCCCSCFPPSLQLPGQWSSELGSLTLTSSFILPGHVSSEPLTSVRVHSCNTTALPFPAGLSPSPGLQPQGTRRKSPDASC